MDFLRNYFVVLLALILIFVLNVSFTLGGQIYDGNSTVKEGDPFLIICRLSLSQAVKWQKDNVPIGSKDKLEIPHDYIIEETEEGNTVFAHLRVKSARPLHSGTYRCHSSHTESHRLIVESDYRVEPNYDFDHYKVLTVKQLRLQLECNSTSTSSSNEPTIKWFKEGTLLKSSDEYEVSGKKLLLKRPSWDSVGNYSCMFYAPNATEVSDKAEIYVIAKPYVRIHPNQLIAIEGEELKIECSVYGRPTPLVMWKFIQFSSQNETSYEKSEGRVTLTTKNESDDLLKAYLTIEKAKMDDRGDYFCIAHNIADNSPVDKDISKAACFVRVKDKYAALWPFLGICVEVVVLCAVIFIYEKKRNKAELEESDTDQSPEQYSSSTAKFGDQAFRPTVTKTYIPLQGSSPLISRSVSLQEQPGYSSEGVLTHDETKPTSSQVHRRVIKLSEKDQFKDVDLSEFVPEFPLPFKGIPESSPLFPVTLPVKLSNKNQVNEVEQEDEETVLQIVDSSRRFLKL